MTALDPAPIIRTLRDEVRALGQYRPETVEALISATERTGEIPAERSPSPFPRGGRTTYPPRDRNAAVIPFRGTYCGARRYPGLERECDRGVVCGKLPGHDDYHVAYGRDDRIIDEWLPNTPEAGA